MDFIDNNSANNMSKFDNIINVYNYAEYHGILLSLTFKFNRYDVVTDYIN